MDMKQIFMITCFPQSFVSNISCGLQRERYPKMEHQKSMQCKNDIVINFHHHDNNSINN